MRRAVGVAFHGDGGHADDRRLREPLLQLVVCGFALGEAHAASGNCESAIAT